MSIKNFNTNPLYRIYFKFKSNFVNILILCFILLIISLTILYFKSLFFIIFFCVIILIKDFIGNYIKKGTPFSLNDIGLIYYSYVYSPYGGIIIILFSLLSKLFFARIRAVHLLKSLIMVFCCFVVSYLRMIDIFQLSIIVIFLRYFIEYLIDILVFRKLNFNELGNRIIRTFLTLLIIYYSKDFLLTIMI
jgi:hypothetical protein